MKALIYVNREKDPENIYLEKIKTILNNAKIDSQVINDNNLEDNISSDVLFVLGGDGTILCVTEFATRNNIPIIGFNVGKLGFLTEFELCEMQTAIDMFKNGDLVVDTRLTMRAEYNGNTYFALNDVVVQRVYIEQPDNRIISVGVAIDDNKVDEYVGEGVLVTSPTGSTAFSFAAGGSILAPGTKAFSVTPIASHSFNNRTVVFSSSCNCSLTLLNSGTAGLFIDGRFVGLLDKNSPVKVTESSISAIFLRRPNYDFYKILFNKLKDSRPKI